MHNSLRLMIASLLVLSAACDTLGIESPSVHLGSELDVGRDLLKGCSSILHEAGPLCSGRKPFRLYAEPSSACKTYFWCSPGRGACLLACPEGKVFNAATSSCQDSSASLAFDHTTCSTLTTTSSSSATAIPTTTQRRKLLGADISAAQPAAAQTIQEPTAAAAAARDDSTVVYNAATGVATDSSGRQIPLPQRRPGPPAFGTWTPHGKQYSTGPFAGSNTVKEPAVGSPRNAAPTHLPSSSSGSGSRGPVTNEIGSRSSSSSSSSPAKPPVYAEDDSAPAAGARALLATQRSTAQQAAARQLSMKRLPPGTTTTSNTPAAVSTTSPAGAASAATAKVATAANMVRPAGPARPEHTRPASSSAAAAAAAAAAPSAAASSTPAPPSAAKALGPDDVDVATVGIASANTADRHHPHISSSHHQHHQAAAARLIRGAAASVTGSSSSSSSSSGEYDSGEAINDMGRLTGPEAEAVRREFAAGPPAHVQPHVVPLPEYLRGAESLYDIHTKGSRHSTKGSRGHTGHGSSHGHKKTSHKVSRGSHHSHGDGDRPSKKHGHRSRSRYEEGEGVDSLQQ